ncbi:paraquat-inducible protein A [Shewanella gaetbuli]|uniref:Paraquat-inducible protein A n=1 Tax=Shewanella gaetbuli TaxID=220752 RepID=A0A9X1ZRI1_9GAMM|nr:paraquat-inducible protein A [Shewanella gaetbuli]MCL1144130.1 paraquat-inducible protein A [Shewanella gaetbuli]
MSNNQTRPANHNETSARTTLESLAPQGKKLGICLCPTCKKVNSLTLTHCIRCKTKLSTRNYASVQQSWALLITAIILLVLANVYPITLLTNRGVVTNDTIFSGIAHLIHTGMIPIAIIVFTASILVPWLKIIGLSLYLCAISFKIPISKRKMMIGFHIIEWIGRWSMLDLFVISLTVALVNMGQLLDAKPAPAATAFALVILLTQLSAKVLDTRLLWDRLETHNDTN